MDKLIHDSTGFTLIEMIMVLSITLIISSFGFMYRAPSIKEDSEIHLITGSLYLARMHASVNKEKVTLEILPSEMNITSKTLERHIKLSPGYLFITRHTCTFNTKGHIKIAKTLRLKTPKTMRKIVLQLGSGSFYVE